VDGSNGCRFRQGYLQHSGRRLKAEGWRQKNGQYLLAYTVCITAIITSASPSVWTAFHIARWLFPSTDLCSALADKALHIHLVTGKDIIHFPFIHTDQEGATGLIPVCRITG